MALDLGELLVRLRVDDSQYRAGLAAAPQTARKAGQQIGDGITRGADGRLRDARGRFAAAGRGMGQSVGQGAESGFKPSLGRISGLLATIGLGKLAADAGTFGLQTAMGMEKADISFTTMLGSASKAKSFIGEMKTFAAQTPFEFPELQTAAGKLMAAGIETKKIIPIMTTLGNVTSGMGTGSEGVSRATIALQQMNAAGRITAEDLNQLRDAGVPVFDLLAAATGKSKKEVAELARTGGLGGKELAAMMKALETGKGLEKFNGLMEKQSQSLEGKFSTLKDTLGQGLAAALKPLMPLMKEGLDGLSKALPGITKGLQGFATGLRDVIKWGQKNMYWIAPLAAVLGGVVGGILLVVGAMRAWAVVQGILNVVMSANPIGIVVVAIAALVAGLIYAYNTSEDFRNAVNTAFTAVGAAARWLWNNALAPAIRAIVNGFAWVVEGIAGMLRALGRVPGFEWATDAADGLDGIARGARDAANGIKDIEAPKDPVVVKVEADGKKARDYLVKMVGEKRAAKILAAADTKQGYRDLEKLVGKKRAAQIKAEAKTKAAQDKINGIKGKTVTVTAKIKAVGTASWSVATSGGKITANANANGGIWRYLRSFAGGGLNENHYAQIARAGDWRVWAEDETGGEAYIPLGASKRNRSIPIWMETGRRLGLLGKAFGVPSLNLGQTGRTVAATSTAAAAAAASSAGPSVFNLFDADGVLLGSMRGEIARNRKHSATVVRMGAR